MTTDDRLALYAAYKLLHSHIANDHGDMIDITEDQQVAAFEEAGKDFDKHNETLGCVPHRLDAIKSMAFIGCHFLAWLPKQDQRRAMLDSLTNCLDYLVQQCREDGKGLNPNQLTHIRRLVLLEADQIHQEVAPGDIWGHGFWRVGLYVSFLAAASTLV